MLCLWSIRLSESLSLALEPAPWPAVQFVNPGRVDQMLMRFGHAAAATCATNRQHFQQISDTYLKAKTYPKLNDFVKELTSLAASSDSNNGSFVQCVSDMFFTFESLKQPWALQMLDATAKLPPGVMEGHTMWLGSYTECNNVTAQVFEYGPNHTIFNVTELFTGQYCSVQGVLSSNNSMPFQVSVGGCVPSSCHNEDVGAIVETGLKLVPFLRNTTSVTGVQCHGERIPLSTTTIIIICLLSFLFTLLLVATFYDVFIYQDQAKAGRSSSESVVIVANDNTRRNRDTLTSEEFTPLLNPQSTENPATSVSSQSRRGKFAALVSRLLLSLSLTRNGQKVLNTSQQGNAMLHSVHGVRFFSMTWVILGHSYVFITMGGMNMANPIQMLEAAKRFSFQAIANASVSVDSFFLLSGLLMAYLTLREMKEVGGPLKINWALFYFHRFWRLTPPYMLVLATYVGLFYYMGSGPLWPTSDPAAECSKYWWTNLLYIQNLVHTDNNCIGWAWYLANDMQFFVISPIFLVLLYWVPIVGLVVTVLALLGNIVATAVISYQHDYPADFPDLLASVATDPAAMENWIHWFKDIYVAPWCRVGPYLVGIIIGYILYRTERKVRLHWVLVVIGWMLAIACNLAVLYGLYGTLHGHPLTRVGRAIYSSLHRPAWAIGLGWLVFACVTGYGGVVNKILSWTALIPLSRLTYMAYLIHPIIMTVYYGSRHTLVYFDDFTMVYLFLGHLVISYAAAFCVTLVFESPMLGLERVLFKRRTSAN